MVRWDHYFPLTTHQSPLTLTNKCLFITGWLWSSCSAPSSAVSSTSSSLVCRLKKALFGPARGAAAVCDLDHREIPLGITVPGAIIGLIGAVLLPWPWPWTPAAALMVPNGIPPAAAWMIPGSIKEGVYAWPAWGPLPDALAPGGN